MVDAPTGLSTLRNEKTQTAVPGNIKLKGNYSLGRPLFERSEFGQALKMGPDSRRQAIV
jgi:hypothetical protein